MDMQLDYQATPAGTSDRNKNMSNDNLEENNNLYHEAQSNMEFLPNYYAWSYKKITQLAKGTVIELGCGSGLGISNYIDRVDHVYAVDFNQVLLDRVADRFSDASKVTPIQADLTGAWQELDGLSADTVIMMDMLEHFEDEDLIFGNMVRLLKPGGIVAIKVPAQSKLYSPMDEASGHYRRYDGSDLKSLAQRYNLSSLFIHHMNPLGGVAYRFKNKRSTNLSHTFSRQQLNIINNLMPVIEMFDVIPGVPGLSLVACFQKTA